MSATLKTIQTGNQLPREWTGNMRGATARTEAEAQTWADAQGADVAYFLAPGQVVFALAAVAQP